MSQEIKADVEDMKDLAHQAKLMGQIKGREAKSKVLSAVGAKSEHPVSDKLHTAEDASKLVGLEIKKKTRDAKVALGKTEAAKAIGAAAEKAGDKLVDAKEAIVDAIAPAAVTTEATTASGVDVTHQEGALNDRVEQRQATLAARQARDEEKIAEAKRQQLVDDATAAAAALKAKVISAAETVAAVVAPALKSAEVTIGKAALAAKDKLDDVAAEGEVATVSKSKLGAHGTDISSVANARNEELAARDHRAALLEKAEEPTLGEKAKHALASAGAAIKSAYVEATTDAPQPKYEHKVSSTGVDISHVENPANAELSAKEAEETRRERLAVAERQKAVLKAEWKAAPASASAHTSAASGEHASASTSEHSVAAHPGLDATLGEKLSALGHSISEAVHSFSEGLRADVDELLNPLPAEPVVVRQGTSASGVDTTALANADNERLGQEFKQRHAAAAPAAAAPAAPAKPAEPLSDRIIKGVLDAGVATRESIQAAQAKTSVATSKADATLKDASATASTKAHETATRVKLTAQNAAHTASLTAAHTRDAVVHAAHETKAAVANTAERAQVATLDAKANVTQKAADAKVSLANTAEHVKASVSATATDAKLATLEAKANVTQKAADAKAALVSTAQDAKTSANAAMQDAKIATLDAKATVAQKAADAKVALANTAEHVKASVSATAADAKTASLHAKHSVENAAMDAKSSMARSAEHVRHETHVALQKLDDKIAPTNSNTQPAISDAEQSRLVLSNVQ